MWPRDGAREASGGTLWDESRIDFASRLHTMGWKWLVECVCAFLSKYFFYKSRTPTIDYMLIMMANEKR